MVRENVIRIINRVKNGENIRPYWPWPEKSNNDITYRFTVCQLNDKLPVGILKK